MLEKNGWIKKDSGISEAELEKIAGQALTKAEDTNTAPTLDAIKNKRIRRDITERFPVTNDDTLQENAARNIMRGWDAVGAEIARHVEAQKIEKAERTEIDALRDRLQELHFLIVDEMQSAEKMGHFDYQNMDTSRQERLDALEEEYNSLEARLKLLGKVRNPKDPKEN